MAEPGTTCTSRDRFASRSKRRLLAKVAIFGAIGMLSTIVDFCVFWFVAVDAALPLILANLAAWLVAVSFSYVMNSVITFATESGRKLTLKAYLGFVAAGVFGFVASSIVLVLAAPHTSILIAKLLAIGVSFGVNFSMSHFVVFRGRPPAR